MATGPRQEYQDLVSKYSQQFGVPYDLALAVLETESNYRPDAVSNKKAKGLFQIMPVIIKRYGVTDPFDPEQNIKAGIEHLGVLLRKYDDPAMAIAAYNAGEPAVDRASGIPNFPETQEYVQRVNAAQRRLSQGQEGSGTVAQDPQYFEQWIYPTVSHQPSPPQPFQEMTDSDGVPLPEDHPDREGILVSWEGTIDDGPTDEDSQKIFQAVDPAGVITREDASSIAALGASVAPGTARFVANRARDVARAFASNPVARGAVTASRFMPGVGMAMLPVVAGAAGVGELYRQTQVPKRVGDFDVESWPRSRFGMHYEGAPDTPWESAYSTFVMALQEGLGEGLGGLAVSGIRRFGQMVKASGFPKGARQAIDKSTPGGDISKAIRGPTGAARLLAERGVNPTVAAKLRVDKAGELASKAADGILEEAERAAGPISVKTENVIEDAYAYLQGSVSHLDIQKAIAWPQLSTRADKILSGVRDFQTIPQVTKKRPPIALLKSRSVGYPTVTIRPGGEEVITPAIVQNLRLNDANRMWREANRAALPIFNAAGRVGQSVDQVGPKVQSALARALRENIVNALNQAERSVPRGKLQSGLRRTKNLGRSGSTRRFGDRWRNQVDNARQWYTARTLAEVGSNQPTSGLVAGAAAFSAPALAGTLLGQPTVGAGLGLGAMSFLSPKMRSVMGGGLYKAGGALGMAPVNLLRAGTTMGGFQPEPYQQKPLVNFESFGLTPPQLDMGNFPFIASPSSEEILRRRKASPPNASRMYISGLDQTGIRRRPLQ